MHSFIKESWYEILVTTIYIINFLAIINLIFREKRSIEATVAWVLVLTTAPAIGCILYIAVGRGISKNNMFKIKEAEDKILKDLKSGTSDGLEELIEGYYPEILRYCIWHTPDRAAAEDAVQETFLKA